MSDIASKPLAKQGGRNAGNLKWLRQLCRGRQARQQTARSGRLAIEVRQTGRKRKNFRVRLRHAEYLMVIKTGRGNGMQARHEAVGR
jgi:hypothetical protein